MEELQSTLQAGVVWNTHPKASPPPSPFPSTGPPPQPSGLGFSAATLEKETLLTQAKTSKPGKLRKAALTPLPPPFPLIVLLGGGGQAELQEKLHEMLHLLAVSRGPGPGRG